MNLILLFAILEIYSKMINREYNAPASLFIFCLFVLTQNMDKKCNFVYLFEAIIDDRSYFLEN